MALIVGIAMPWLFMGKSILIGFQERDLQVGFGTWFGGFTFTVPLMFLIMWIAQLFVK